MKKELLNIKLPQKYEEHLIDYKEGLDNVPNWIELSEKGYTKEQYKKMNCLVSIERMKYELVEDRDELTDEEIKEVENFIKEAIEKYNNI